MSSGKISVVVPVYNVEKYISDCISSLSRQIDRNFEIIVVNDGSKDSSIDIIHSQFGDLENLHIIEQENRGLGAARSAGIDNASGEFILFVDSDDIVTDVFLSNLRLKQQTNNYDVVSACFTKIDESNKYLERQAVPILEKLNIQLSYYEKVLAALLPSISCAKLYRKEFLVNTGVKFPDRIPHEDLFFTYKILRSCASHDVVFDYGYLWRQRQHSLSRTISKSHVNVPFQLREDTYRYLKSKGASHREMALAARRNLIFLDNILRRAKEIPNDVLDYLNSLMDQNAIKIKEDIDTIASSDVSKLYIPDTIKLFASGRKIKPVANKIKSGNVYDIAFFPLRAYHLRESRLILDILNKNGKKTALIDTECFRDGHEVARQAKEYNLQLISLKEFIEKKHSVRCVVFFNDWEPLMRVVARACHAHGISTVGWVEGIQDYDDVDTGRLRYPYRRSKHVILPGRFDGKYFRKTEQILHYGQVSRVQEMWQDMQNSEIETPKNIALINSNFSYGVLEDQREGWLEDAVNACLEVGLQPVISRHPFDTGKEFKEYETTESFFQILPKSCVTIQRFASGILEALSHGVPSIYFVPPKENVDKFRNPLGAYVVAHTYDELLSILKNRRYKWNKDKTIKFLEHHTNLNPNLSSTDNIGSHVASIFLDILGQSNDASSALAEDLGRLSLFNDKQTLRKESQTIGPIFTDKETTKDDSGARLTSPIRNKIDIKDMPKSDIQFQNGPVNSYHAKINQIMDVLPDEVLNIQTGNALFDKGDYETALAIYFASYKKYGLKMYLGNAFLTAQRLKLPGIESTDDLLLRFSGNKFKYYYINLDQDHLRSKLMMEKNPETHLIRFPAFDGSEADIGQLIRDGYIMESCDREEIDISLGTLGCYMSHILLYEKRLLKDKYFDQFVVLEDDVKLCKDFERRIQDEILKYIGDWDLVVLDCYPKADGLKIAEGIYKIDGKFRLGRNGGTYGLLYNRNGCQKIYNKIKGLREMLPIDVYMHNECADLNIFYCKFNDNPLVSHNFGIGSTIECANVPKKYQEMLDAKIDM